MRYIFTILSFLRVLQVAAQSNSTSILKDKFSDSSGELVIYAQVRIDSLNLRTASDLDGNYTLKDVPLGTHRLTAQMFGFQKVKKTAVQEIGLIDFTLQEKVQSLDAVVISMGSEKEKKENSEEAVRVTEPKEVKLQSADFGEVIAKTEGINVQQEGGLGSNTLDGLLDDQIRFFMTAYCSISFAMHSV